MGPQQKRKLTVLVVPEGETTLHRWHLPAWLMDRRVRWSGAAVLFLIVVHTIFATYRSLQVSSLLDENRALRDHLAEISSRMEVIQSDLSRMDSLDHRVRHILGIEYDASSNEGLGVGGPAVPSADNYIQFRPRDAAKLRRLDADIETAATQTQRQEARLEDLLNYFGEQRSRLSSTPSIWPVRGWVTSDFGMRVDPFTGGQRMHEGLDVATNLGAPIVAPADGVVIFGGARGGYGKVLSIDHGYGLVTTYGHLSEIKVSQGQRINRGDVIATVGSTGRSTGPHLHYEVLMNDVPVDPTRYILN